MNKPETPPYQRFKDLLEGATEVLSREAAKRGGYVVRVTNKYSNPVSVIGDIHGDYYSFTKALEYSKDASVLDSGLMIFLGDYVDRGPPEGQIAVLASIASMVNDFGLDRVIPLRGNHEPPEGLEPLPHDYIDALRAVYGGSRAHELYALSRKFFDELPHAAIVDNVALFVHGGLPISGFELGIEGYLASKREPWQNFVEILWNDPTEDTEYYVASPRGAGFLFGPRITSKALKLLGVKRVIRGHEPVLEGYKLNHGGTIVTLFSRLGPPYYNEVAAAIICDRLDTLAGNSIESCIRFWR